MYIFKKKKELINAMRPQKLHFWPAPLENGYCTNMKILCFLFYHFDRIVSLFQTKIYIIPYTMCILFYTYTYTHLYSHAPHSHSHLTNDFIRVPVLNVFFWMKKENVYIFSKACVWLISMGLVCECVYLSPHILLYLMCMCIHRCAPIDIALFQSILCLSFSLYYSLSMCYGTFNIDICICTLIYLCVVFCRDIIEESPHIHIITHHNCRKMLCSLG